MFIPLPLLSHRFASPTLPFARSRIHTHTPDLTLPLSLTFTLSLCVSISLSPFIRLIRKGTAAECCSWLAAHVPRLTN